jgi:hypothetical protein
MITDAHATTLKELGAGFVSALKTAQVRKLIGSGELQLSLFDQRNLVEITSEEFPSERLVVCRNPHLAAERPANARIYCRRPNASSPRSGTWSTGLAARYATPPPGRSASAPAV